MIILSKYCVSFCIKSTQLAKKLNTSGICQQLKNMQSSRSKYYLVKDKIPDNFTLIYRAPMENYLSVTKNITSIAACLVAIVALYKYKLGDEITTNSSDNSFEVTIGTLVSPTEDLNYFAGGFLILTLAIRYVVLKYPLRIYRNIDKYIAVFEGQIPFKKSKVLFRKGEVMVAKKTLLNPWHETTYQINNTKAILLEEYFKTPSELHQMLKK